MFNKLGRYQRQFLHTLWQDIKARPFSKSLTLLVFSLALAITGFLFVIISNLSDGIKNWQMSANKIVVYINDSATHSDIMNIEREIMQINYVNAVSFVSKDQGLSEFKQTSGLRDIIELLDFNPLPDIFIVIPDDKILNNIKILENIITKLQHLPHVANVDNDNLWLQKIEVFISFLKQLTYILGTVLLSMVILIIANTIRLEISTKIEEIKVSRLVGATNIFITMPFVYSGVVYGLLAAIIASFSVHIVIYYLNIPLSLLFSYYNISYSFVTFEVREFFYLAVISSLIGLVTSSLCANFYIRRVEVKSP